ncbi:polysaccharide biosynthesis tyrosine autokinase [Arthrobacter sp. B1I2]|uniref:polysaccharide biosynthesis tyrosine autokinase n=1 Tax=Arthrobacter sp. B1I2 TaxID=3042263 RepID=UPI00277F5D91|nr:polysaccharide biosynthesis tyrosine autokinase [Arthrobacter sp. B1I2]MDQ0731132.1 capsular exopolysaccharide synthesis family protein [Arthrobacter sp. B1I2]
MEITDYFKLLRRNWLLIAASTLVGLLLAGVAAMVTTPTYTARTQLFVATQNSGSVAELQQGNTFSQARVASYVETSKTPMVLQPVIDSLGLDMSPSALASKISANVEGSTVLLNISATDSSPVRSAAIAEAVANSLISAVNRLESPSKDGTSPVRLSVVTPASAPSAPASPNTSLYLLAGLLIGAAVGVGSALVRSAVDTRVLGEVDLRRITNASVLGGIAYEADAGKKPLLTQVQPQSPRAESFRQIRTNLQFAQVGHSSKSVLITSSLPGEGKSTTAVNMAISLAQAGQRVALVDADLRRPMVGEYLGLDRSVGLTTYLVGQGNLEDLLQLWGTDDLHVLASGQIPPNPSELLGSAAMLGLIQALEERYDAVVIDAPPLLPVTDAAVLAQRVGGVVLVVGSQLVKSTDLQKSLSSLEMVEADLLGVVMNRLPAKEPHAYTYSYYSTTSADTPAVTPALREASGGRSRKDRNPNDFDQIIFGDEDSSTLPRYFGPRTPNS